MKVVQTSIPHDEFHLVRRFSGLTCSGLAKKISKRKYVREARKAADKMKFIMRNRGLNNLHRYLLMQADLLAVTSKKQHREVKLAYDKAIATAGKAGFVQDAALGNELASQYFRSIGDEFWEEQYLTRACELYYEWGALAKVADLTSRHRLHVDTSRITLNKESHIKSSSRGWFSGDGSTKILKSVDLDSLSFAITSVTDVTRDLSATVDDLRSQQRRRTISSKTSL